MARFASLFSTADEAQQAASELDETQFSDGVKTQIISREDWEAVWRETDKNEPEEEVSTKGGNVIEPVQYLDIWLDEDTIQLFSDGLKQGGAILVVDVPDPFAREAEKIMTKNNGKIGA